MKRCIYRFEKEKNETVSFPPTFVQSTAKLSTTLLVDSFLADVQAVLGFDLQDRQHWYQAAEFFPPLPQLQPPPPALPPPPPPEQSPHLSGTPQEDSSLGDGTPKINCFDQDRERSEEEERSLRRRAKAISLEISTRIFDLELDLEDLQRNSTGPRPSPSSALEKASKSAADLLKNVQRLQAEFEIRQDDYERGDSLLSFFLQKLTKIELSLSFLESKLISLIPEEHNSKGIV